MLNLTFGPSFKVKRWFTGFGELFFRWIQICIGSLMRRSSFVCLCYYSQKTKFVTFFFTGSICQSINVAFFLNEIR